MKKMKNSEIERILTEIASGEICTIQEKIRIDDDADLVHFICDNLIESACITYSDGTFFHLWDWQGGRPATPEEIEDYDWSTIEGQKAIVLNGLPRVFY